MIKIVTYNNFMIKDRKKLHSTSQCMKEKQHNVFLCYIESYQGEFN